MTAVLTLDAVSKAFRRSGGQVQAVDRVGLELVADHTLALVGQSGCGKSTLGKICVGLIQPDSGRVLDERGTDLARHRGRLWRPLRPAFQLVFQDPFASFAPHLSLRQSLLPVACRIHRLDAASAVVKVRRLLADVGLEEAHLSRHPGQLSGGQLQRAALARALLAEPRLLVADEVASALDVSMQDEITRLLGELQRKWQFSMLFITHDLGLAKEVADEICVMEDGQILEQGTAQRVIDSPTAPATQRLVESIPRFPWGEAEWRD